MEARPVASEDVFLSPQKDLAPDEVFVTPTQTPCSISSEASSSYESFEPNEHPLSRAGSDGGGSPVVASLTSLKALSPISQKAIFRPPSDRTSAQISVTSGTQSPWSRSLASPTTSTTKLPDIGSDPRTALFDDHVAAAHVPGSLHLAPDSTIERLVERQGVIPLIRQLAEDLAHRDKELVSLRLRAEERERALKRMLVEVEVSNADIEKRLAAAILPQKSSRDTMQSGGDSLSFTESIDEMMQQAMDEDNAFSIVDDGASGMDGTMDMDDAESLRDDMMFTLKGTVKVRSNSNSALPPPRRQSDNLSILSNTSNASSDRRGSTLRGWKDFFWGQRNADGQNGDPSTQRRISSNSIQGRRRIITGNTFAPPPDVDISKANLTRNSSTSSLASPSKGYRSPNLQINTTSIRRTPAPSTPYVYPHFASDKSQPKPPHFKAVGIAASSLSQNPTPNMDWLVQKRTSNTVATWALKLVSGAPPLPNQDNDMPVSPTSPTRPRNIMFTGDDMPTGISDRRPSLGGDKEDLHKIMARNVANGPASPPRRRAQSAASTGPAPAAKSGKFFQDIREQIPIGNASQNGTAPDHSNGPVEMDTIVPHAVQPPTLLQSWNEYYPTDYLTDRFGFIYDKKQKAMSIKSVTSLSSLKQCSSREPDSRSSKQNHITAEEGSRPLHPHLPENDKSLESSVAKTPTKLQELRHPNRSDSGSSLEIPQQRSPATSNSIMERISRPGASVTSHPSATNAFSEAPLALRSPLYNGTISTAEASTVRLLLGQLSDLHDSLQRDRSIKWNEFLKKIREERRRGEQEENGTPEALMSDGELIGIATLNNEGRNGKQRWKEFKSLVLGGIPVAYRWKIWAECSGATALKVPGYYEDILQNGGGGEDDQAVIAQIAMDINRTLTDNIFFRKGPGVGKLKQVLLAYSRRNPAVGYCQGMNMIAASLLLIMPSEEDAFWVLCSIVERILPKTYFETSLLASRADQQVLKQYVREVLPVLHIHLAKLGVELEALTFQWFLSIFTDTLAAEALFRVWDVVLCVAGSTFLFQTALALLRLNEKALLNCKSAAGVYSYLNGEMTHQGISIDGLIRESDGLKGLVKRRDVDARRETAVAKELRDMGELGGGETETRGIEEEEQERTRRESTEEGAAGLGGQETDAVVNTEPELEPELDPPKVDATEAVTLDFDEVVVKITPAIDNNEDTTMAHVAEKPSGVVEIPKEVNLDPVTVDDIDGPSVEPTVEADLLSTKTVPP